MAKFAPSTARVTDLHGQSSGRERRPLGTVGADDRSALRAVTLVPDPIARPGEPRHFMTMEPARGTAQAKCGDTLLARSYRALVVREVGLTICEPVIYFPREDVQGRLLKPSARSAFCPIKGTASYLDLSVGGGTIESAAWSYTHVLDFDPRLEPLRGLIAFDTTRVRVESGLPR